MSLLDFAQWGKDEPTSADADRPKAAALVEMEEAAALDERAPRINRDDEAAGSVSAETAAAEAGTAEMELASIPPDAEVEATAAI